MVVVLNVMATLLLASPVSLYPVFDAHLLNIIDPDPKVAVPGFIHAIMENPVVVSNWPTFPSQAPLSEEAAVLIPVPH
jgi:hypothetical protein